MMQGVVDRVDRGAQVRSAEGSTVLERAESIGWNANDLAQAEAEALGAQIVAGAARVARTTADWVQMLGVFDARGGAGWYEMDVVGWLAWSCSMGIGTARDHVRVARGLRELPLIAAAFERGELSYSKVRACTRIAGLIDEEVLLRRAQDFTAAQLERAVTGFRAGRTERLAAEMRRSLTFTPQTDGSVRMVAWIAPEEAALLKNALEMAETRWRSEHTRAKDAEPSEDQLLLTDDEPVEPRFVMRGESVDDALKRERKEAEHARQYLEQERAEGRDPHEPGYSRVDALLDMARGYIDSGPADASGEDRDLVVVHVRSSDLQRTAHFESPTADNVPERTAHDTDDDGANPPDVTNATDAAHDVTDDIPVGTEAIHDGVDVSAETPRSHDEPPASDEIGPLAGGSAWIEGVGAVHASTAARIACNGRVQPVVLDDTTGEVLYLGREQRFASKQQKRAMKARDRHCVFPGCIRAVRLHAHHLTLWSHGGHTDINKMVLLCQHHHVVVHAAQITISKRPGRPGYDVRRANGELITAQNERYYCRQGSRCGTMIPPHDRMLLTDLAEDTRQMDEPDEQPTESQWGPGRWRADADPDWQLPREMSDLADVSALEDPRAAVFPRWAGDRLRGSDLWELMEEGALTPRTNRDAGY